MYSFEDIKELIEAPTDKWIIDARKESRSLDALVNGVDFINQLISQIEKIESKDRATAREKYSKDIRGMFHRITQKRSFVFSADGASDIYNTDQKKNVERIETLVNNFKGNKSILKYLQEHYFELMDVDPNGLIFMEYVGTEKVYPTYKSIKDIRSYVSNGQLVDYVLFEPVKTDEGLEYRFVDETKDITVLHSGENMTIVEDKSFEHPFSKVPAVIISPFEKLGTEQRYSTIDPIVPDAEDYARDRSVMTLYKFINGFPIVWRYKQICKVCNGSGKQDSDTECKICDGRGDLGKNDVTDVIEIPLPKTSDDIDVAPNVTGFVQPDIETLRYYREEQERMETSMEATLWGLDMVSSRDETATGRFIDQQPIINKLDTLTDTAEWVYNQLAEMLIKWLMPENEKVLYQRVFGRRFIIESADALLEKYAKGQSEGWNNTIMDNILYQIIVSQFSTNRPLLEIMLKKSRIEPYVHLPYKEVSTMFGNVEAEKKVLFQSFWEGADKLKNEDVLTREFEAYVATNTKVVVTETE